jgi:diguanylate cyclase (GGDEF)-like protein
MVEPLRLLLSEDNPADADLEIRELKRGGMNLQYRLAITPESFIASLREFAPHIVVSDFSMPAFDGMEALRLTREIAPDIPFIFVSGTLGEDYAIRALRNGATDYVLKSNLMRLPAAIDRAIKGAEEQRARRHAEAGLRRAQLMARLGHIVTGPGGAFEGWAESLPDLIGVQNEAMPRSTREWLDLIHPGDRETFRSASLNAAATGKRVDVGYRLRHDSGAWIHIKQVIEPLETHVTGKSERWFSTLQDVTDQKLAQEAVRRLNRVHQVLSGINNLIVRARNRDELFRESCRIAVEQGRFPLAWIGMVDPTKTRLEVVATGADAGDYLSLMPTQLGDDAPGAAALAVRTGVPILANDIEKDPLIAIKDASLERGFRSLVMLPLVVARETVGVLALYAEQAGFFDEAEMKLLTELAGDISFAVDHIGKAQKLEYLSHHDPLTGLANRTLLGDRLTQAMHATQEGRLLALAVLDIERFKSINDSLGRASGDALLARMAERLVDLAGDVSRVSRTGPDQFAVMIPNVRKVESVARAIDDGFSRVEGAAFDLGGSELRVAVRCGIALCPADGADADTLFRNAEAALKKAKRTREKYLYYTEEMTERVAERLTLENKLRHAIDNDEFVLHYQPKVDLRDRRIVGLEALMRWQTPEGLVPPLKFIPVLEETGLIAQVGAWAIRRAVLDHRAWAEKGLPAPRIAVNVSAMQLREKNFVSIVEQMMAEGLKPTALDLEITESLIMDDIAGNIEKLNAVRALGIEISIDDFGTGYSSLAYLAKLPVHTLKIDRAFVITMDQDPNAMTLVSTIISLAHSLRLNVVAEGVETESQANTLRLLRCDSMQGYLVSKPVPADSVVKLLEAAR